MKPVRIFRHIDCEGPGYLGTVLDQQQIPYEIIAIDAGETVPPTIDDVSGLVFMGGSMSVNDPLAWIEQELALIREANKRDLPMLGFCLGSQLIAKALGGTVSKGHGMELGWAPVTKCQPEQQDGWFDGLDPVLPAFHWHGETFSLPDGVTLLLSSECYAHQAFSIGNTLALQFHLEMTADMVREWVGLYQDDVHSSGACVQAETYILAEAENGCHELQGVADHVFTNWIQRL
ncbi:MAG: type 1 glutamine amidotransferase [Thiohalomonadales bacterium]|nr:type 1 glutamine amidotransferase [Thiohalomonadales bacterium]